MQLLQSFLSGAWVSGHGEPLFLENPATEEPLAETRGKNLPLVDGLEFARRTGGPSLRTLTFAERGKLLAALADHVHQHRDELIDLAIRNGGNTRSDAKFDVDGGAAALSHYATLGASLGDRRILEDGDAVQLGRSPRFGGRHLWMPRRGVAVHINAFNFPAWGMCEKAACALLAGMPIVAKPALSSALVAYRLAQLFAPALPTGAFSFVCGGAHELPALLGDQDVISFTGSSATAARLRALPRVLDASVRLNVEADSLNAAALGADVEVGSDTYELALRDIVKEMTQKAGQKCTAIRRILAPPALLERLTEDLISRLREVAVGDPADDRVRMGPLASAIQFASVRDGTARIAAEARMLLSGQPTSLAAGTPGRGHFVGPTLLRADGPAPTVHDLEVFGPVATVVRGAEDGEALAAQVALGRGGLVCSLYCDDRRLAARFIEAAGPYHGRIAWGSQKIAAHAPTPGMVMSELVHGGPGRAGGGEELGGLRGLSLYAQRVALQGDRALIDALSAGRLG